MKFLSETKPWIGFSSRLGTAGFGTVALVIFDTITVQFIGLSVMLYARMYEFIAWRKYENEKFDDSS